MPDRARTGRWPEGFARGRSNRRALLVLASLRALTPRKLLDLASREGSASVCLAAVRAGKAGSQADRRFARELDADALEAALAACGARFVTLGSAEYPQCFAGLTDPPAAIFVRGREIDRLGPSVAIVGARNCSELGRELARSLGRALGAAGSWVVSGAARGIDAAAHEGALEVGGATVAVLGCGIDAAYPPASRSLLARIARTGTVVSEYPPACRRNPSGSRPGTGSSPRLAPRSWSLRERPGAARSSPRITPWISAGRSLPSRAP